MRDEDQDDRDSSRSRSASPSDVQRGDTRTVQSSKMDNDDDDDDQDDDNDKQKEKGERRKGGSSDEENEEPKPKKKLKIVKKDTAKTSSKGKGGQILISHFFVFSPNIKQQHDLIGYGRKKIKIWKFHYINPKGNSYRLRKSSANILLAPKWGSY